MIIIKLRYLPNVRRPQIFEKNLPCRFDINDFSNFVSFSQYLNFSEEFEPVIYLEQYLRGQYGVSSNK